MIQFRPALWMTVLLFPALLILVTLGTWQLQRMQWKLDLIEKFEISNAAPAISLPVLLADDPKLNSDVAWKKVKVEGQYLQDFGFRRLYALRDGLPGSYYISLFKTELDQVFFVVRGFVPDRLSDEVSPSPLGTVQITGLLRPVGKKRLMIPDADIKSGLWFWRDLPMIAADMGFNGKFEPKFTLDLIKPDTVSQWPVPTGLPPTPVNNHLDYALTWFGLALVLLVIYLLWHKKNGRLRFGSK